MQIRRILKKKSLILITLILFLIWFFVFHRNVPQSNSNVDIVNSKKLEDEMRPGLNQKPRLAVIVPFRDRFDELIEFVPHITKFLESQDLGPFNIYIINQSRRYRFNRGALANVGYYLTKNLSDYIAIHDVDLIPINKNLSYSYPEQGPYHLSSPAYHPQYNYSKYFGGILLINNKHFELVNGMSNRYFGWGLEDDEFYTRIKAAKLPIFQPENLTTNRTNTFLHFHYNRKRDTFKTKEQREILRRRDRLTGLSDLKYSLTSRHDIAIDERYKCILYNVELFCDTNRTPWCLYNNIQTSYKPK